LGAVNDGQWDGAGKYSRPGAHLLVPRKFQGGLWGTVFVHPSMERVISGCCRLRRENLPSRLHFWSVSGQARRTRGGGDPLGGRSELRFFFGGSRHGKSGNLFVRGGGGGGNQFFRICRAKGSCGTRGSLVICGALRARFFHGVLVVVWGGDPPHMRGGSHCRQSFNKFDKPQNPGGGSTNVFLKSLGKGNGQGNWDLDFLRFWRGVR